ncbi:hypothetical protein M8C21_032319 [Ambrosia artemisiifolia]|uniref:CRAL-TRIO domain-containing protein n=1 Tax=Ambrosia artemisiifolia TaxID=4212 RepID=A0AAD5GE74_AMBAR|nr:hypothetical protein M8C21_032319 [Ambrosia artemisiifolia]
MAAADEDFKVVVVPSDRYGVDPRPLTSSAEDSWHDCSSDPAYNDEEFPALDALQFFRIEPGLDQSGNRIVRIVGKYFPAPVIGGEWLKKYVTYKISTELPEGPFCIVYMHSTVQNEYNNPGITILRWIYEQLPSDFKDRLQVFYFVHPGLRSRLLIATLGRFLLSGGLYWKVKYVSRLQYLWDDMKKGTIEIPDFVVEHDDVLEKRPLTDYGIEPDPLHLTGLPSTNLAYGRYDRWTSGDLMS